MSKMAVNYNNNECKVRLVVHSLICYQHMAGAENVKTKEFTNVNKIKDVNNKYILAVYVA
jgi:hypothetical protein